MAISNEERKRRNTESAVLANERMEKLVLALPCDSAGKLEVVGELSKISAACAQADKSPGHSLATVQALRVLADSIEWSELEMRRRYGDDWMGLTSEGPSEGSAWGDKEDAA